MTKKFTLLMSALLLTIPSFAQAKPTVSKSDALQKQLEQLTKEIEKQQIQIMLAQEKNTETERCGESGHTRAQAKNHKGQCMWISDQPLAEATPRARYSYDPKTGENTYIAPNGTVYSWKSKVNPQKSKNNQDTARYNATSPDKYPPYW